jgi:hypothetical protein
MSTGPIIRPPAWRRWALLGVLGFGAMLGIAQGVAELMPEHDGPTCGYPGFRNALAREGYVDFDFPFDHVRCAGGFGFARANSTRVPDLNALFEYRGGKWELYGTSSLDMVPPNGIPEDVLERILPPTLQP